MKRLEDEWFLSLVIDLSTLCFWSFCVTLFAQMCCFTLLYDLPHPLIEFCINDLENNTINWADKRIQNLKQLKVAFGKKYKRVFAVDVEIVPDC